MASLVAGQPTKRTPEDGHGAESGFCGEAHHVVEALDAQGGGAGLASWWCNQQAALLEA